MAAPKSSEVNHARRTLFVFIDESGNLDFGPRGTRNFVMASVSTFDPARAASKILDLKYLLLADGYDLPAFHASEDRQWVRDQFLPLVNLLPDSRGHVVFGNKDDLKPELRKPEMLIAAFGREVLKLTLADSHISGSSGIVVIFDQTLPAKRRGPLVASVKSLLKGFGCPYRLYFHRMSTDALGQAADYLAWSKYVAIERGEDRPWAVLRESLRPHSREFGDRQVDPPRKR